MSTNSNNHTLRHHTNETLEEQEYLLHALVQPASDAMRKEAKLLLERAKIQSHPPKVLDDCIAFFMRFLSVPVPPADGKGELTPRQFVDDILSACDASNWDAERNTGDYFSGLKDAYENIHGIAAEYQTAMYKATKP